MIDVTVPPYIPPRHQVEVDGAEFSALRTIVMALVAEKALESQISLGIPAQTWINDLSARCQESIIAGDVRCDDRQAGERFKTKVLNHINNILGSIMVGGAGNKPK